MIYKVTINAFSKSTYELKCPEKKSIKLSINDSSCSDQNEISSIVSSKY